MHLRIMDYKKFLRLLAYCTSPFCAVKNEDIIFRRIEETEI